MDIQEIAMTLRSFWGLWLMLLFVGIVVWTFWPSQARKREMMDHANIPFREE